MYNNLPPVIRTKILHIWNTAGVASIIAKYMDKYIQTDSWVITRSISDRFGFTTFGETFDCGSKMFIAKAIWLSRKYDLIHVHALDKIVPWLKRIYPRKPVVLHYPGSNVRARWEERLRYWRKADLLLVATSDLLDGAPTNAIWLPNPVDTDLFCSRSPVRRSGHAFHISYDADDLAQKFAQEYGLKLTIHNPREEPIPYTELGMVLSSYEYYIDVKRSRSPGALGILVEVLSKTGLEALACGCKVIRSSGEVMKGLPSVHKPEKSVRRLWELYTQVIKKTP